MTIFGFENTVTMYWEYGLICLFKNHFFECRLNFFSWHLFLCYQWENRNGKHCDKRKIIPFPCSFCNCLCVLFWTTVLQLLSPFLEQQLIVQNFYAYYGNRTLKQSGKYLQISEISQISDISKSCGRRETDYFPTHINRFSSQSLILITALSTNESVQQSSSVPVMEPPPIFSQVGQN